MPITPHTNGEPLLKRSSSYSQFATILLVVWCANSDGSALPSKANSNLKKMLLTDSFVRVIASSIRTNRARCALNRKILDLLDEESISGEAVVELIYKFDKKPYYECLKM